MVISLPVSKSYLEFIWCNNIYCWWKRRNFKIIYICRCFHLSSDSRTQILHLFIVIESPYNPRVSGLCGSRIDYIGDSNNNLGIWRYIRVDTQSKIQYESSPSHKTVCHCYSINSERAESNWWFPIGCWWQYYDYRTWSWQLVSILYCDCIDWGSTDNLVRGL